MNLLCNKNITTWSFDMETNLLMMCDVLKVWIGYSDEDMSKGLSLVQEIVYTEDIHLFNEHMKRLYSGQKSSLEHRIMIQTGQIRWVQSIGVPVLSGDNKVCRLDGIVLDITEKRITQEQLEQTCSSYQKKALDTSDVASWSINTKSRKVLISDAIVKITGYPIEKASEIRFLLDIAHVDEWPLIKRIITDVRLGISVLSEYRIIHKSGEIRWIQLNVIPRPARSQNLSRHDGTIIDTTVIDITARKIKEAELHRSQQRNKSLLQYKSNAGRQVDKLGNIANINPIVSEHPNGRLQIIEEHTLDDSPEKTKLEQDFTESKKLNQQLIIRSPQAIVLKSHFNFIWMMPQKRMEKSSKFQEHSDIRSEERVTHPDRVMNTVGVAPISTIYKGKHGTLSLLRDKRKLQFGGAFRKISVQTISENEARYCRLQRSLDEFSRDLFGVMKISQMEQRLISEVQDILQVSNVSFLEVENNEDQLCTIIEVEKGYSLKISEVKGSSYLLFIHEKPLTLNITAIRMWLETITRYVSVLFDNFLLIGDLTKELQQAASRHVAPTWLLRFMFNMSENERKQLAQDLHDSVLQEQIIWYRKLDQLLEDTSITGELRGHLEQVSEGLLDVIYQLRITCNELRPPMLIKDGLISSIEELFHFTQLRSNYRIHFEAENFTTKINEDVLIGLYRIIQELLANASKHSSSRDVWITLSSHSDRVQLEYQDNGVGMLLTDTRTKDSFKGMGIYSIKERVHSLEGRVQFVSSQDKGLAVFISIPSNKYASKFIS